MFLSPARARTLRLHSRPSLERSSGVSQGGGGGLPIKLRTLLVCVRRFGSPHFTRNSPKWLASVPATTCTTVTKIKSSQNTSQTGTGGKRYIVDKLIKTSRFKFSFIPEAVAVLNLRSII
ncbi:hypothetical protein BaRGS_00004891, partial [Batillaria attramentaria]